MSLAWFCPDLGFSLSEDGSAVSVYLSVCVSSLINGSLPEAVFPLTCPPFIIHFNPQQKAACLRLGADGTLLLSVRSCLAGTCMLYKPVRFCVSAGFFCLFCYLVPFCFPFLTPHHLLLSHHTYQIYSSRFSKHFADTDLAVGSVPVSLTH